LQEVLPGFVFKRLQTGFKAFGQKMRGYLTNEAIVVATESRTSSPVRVPRHPVSLQHPQVKNLYPAGEGQDMRRYCKRRHGWRKGGNSHCRGFPWILSHRGKGGFHRGKEGIPASL